MNTYAPVGAAEITFPEVGKMITKRVSYDHLTLLVIESAGDDCVEQHDKDREEHRAERVQLTGITRLCRDRRLRLTRLRRRAAK